MTTNDPNRVQNRSGTKKKVKYITVLGKIVKKKKVARRHLKLDFINTTYTEVFMVDQVFGAYLSLYIFSKMVHFKLLIDSY